MIVAHVDYVLTIGAVILTVVLIAGSVVNLTIAVPAAVLISWKGLQGKSKRVRVCCGLLSTLFLFVVLWMLEVLAIFLFVDLPTAQP